MAVCRHFEQEVPAFVFIRPEVLQRLKHKTRPKQQQQHQQLQLQLQLHLQLYTHVNLAKI